MTLRTPAAADTRPTVSPRTRFRPDIQGLRAVAVLAIVAYHAGLPLPGGFTGVDVFFVISGFVITGLLHTERLATGRVSLSAFYRRRIRRILPAAAVLIVVTAALSVVLLSPVGEAQKAAGEGAAASAVFLANAYFFRFAGGYFEPAAATNPFQHMWSLSVEEQFYVVFPLLFVIAWLTVRRWGPRALIALLALAGIGSFALSVIFTYGFFAGVGPGELQPLWADTMSFAFYSPFTRAWEFLAGAVLAVILSSRTPGARFSAVSAWLGVAALTASFLLISSTQPFPGVVAVLPVAGTVLLLSAGAADQPTRPSHALSAGPMTRVGTLSYSWYLWHWPLMVFAFLWLPALPTMAVGVAAAAVSLGVAALSYRFVEYPIHRGGRFPGHTATVLILVAGVALPFAAGRALIAGSQAGWGREDIREIQAAVLPRHADSACSSLAKTLTTACRFPTPDATSRVLLIGDSNADHLVEPVITAGHDLGADVDVLAAPRCPMLTLPAYPSPACETWQRENLAGIEDDSYDVVIVSNSISYPTSLPELVARPGEELDTEEAIERWAGATARTVDEIGASATVVLVDPIPPLESGPTAYPQCLRPSVLSDGPAPGCGTSSSEYVEFFRDRVVRATRTATDPATIHFDASTRQCAADRTCRAVVDGTVLYRDPAHLSVVGSLEFTEQWRETLRSALAAAGPSRGGASE